MSWIGHALGGFAAFAADQIEHGEALPLADYVTSPRFWFESFQNWQSEFLSVGVDGLVQRLPEAALVAGIETRACAARRDRPLSGSARHSDVDDR